MDQKEKKQNRKKKEYHISYPGRFSSTQSVFSFSNFAMTITLSPAEAPSSKYSSNSHHDLTRLYCQVPSSQVMMRNGRPTSRRADLNVLAPFGRRFMLSIGRPVFSCKASFFCFLLYSGISRLRPIRPGEKKKRGIKERGKWSPGVSQRNETSRSKAKARYLNTRATNWPEQDAFKWILSIQPDTKKGISISTRSEEILSLSLSLSAFPVGSRHGTAKRKLIEAEVGIFGFKTKHQKQIPATIQMDDALSLATMNEASMINKCVVRRRCSSETDAWENKDDEAEKKAQPPERGWKGSRLRANYFWYSHLGIGVLPIDHSGTMCLVMDGGIYWVL